MIKIRKKEWSAVATRNMMLAPALLLIFVLAAYPLLYNLYISFFNLNMITGERELVGLQNYINVFTSREFFNSLRVTFRFVVFSLAIQVPLGVLIALLLNQEFYGRWILRSLILMPWTVPTLVNATLWDWIYNVHYGALNRLLLQFNIIDSPIVWFANTDRALAMVVLADTWRMLPLYVLMFLASLQTIPATQMEAATIDGAGALKRFFYVTIPLIKPMLMVVLVIRTMQALRVFEIIFVLTRGGPANSTMVISYFIYTQSFSFMRFSFGSALAMVVALLSVVIAVVYVKVLRSDDIY